MRAGGDVDEVVLRLWIERPAAGKVEQFAVDLLEVPRIGKVDQVRLDARLGGDRRDVLRDEVGEPLVGCAVDEDESVDPQVLVHGEADGRPPLVPTRGVVLAAI